VGRVGSGWQETRGRRARLARIRHPRRECVEEGHFGIELLCARCRDLAGSRQAGRCPRLPCAFPPIPMGRPPTAQSPSTRYLLSLVCSPTKMSGEPFFCDKIDRLPLSNGMTVNRVSLVGHLRLLFGEGPIIHLIRLRASARYALVAHRYRHWLCDAEFRTRRQQSTGSS
jgi:hypothetical protein